VTDTNVFQLSQPGTFADLLTQVLRNGARALLSQAVEAEVAALLGYHADKLTDVGRQRLVRHGHLPEREVWPSGLKLITKPAAVIPPAPGRFSTTTGWPRTSLIDRDRHRRASAFRRRFCLPMRAARRASKC
jgi:hypothetical protein